MPQALPTKTEPGLSKREFIATHLHAALIIAQPQTQPLPRAQLAKEAADQADALLSELNTNQP